MTKTLLAGILSIVWLVPARGAPLAPSKPSQIVTLQPDVLIGTPPCTGVQLGVCAELATAGTPVAVNVVANGYLTKDK